MISTKGKLLVLGLFFFSSCISDKKIDNIETAIKYLKSKENRGVKIDELIKPLKYIEIDTFNNSDGSTTYNLLFQSQYIYEDTCFLIIEYNRINESVIDFYKRCQ
ncbi:hypothetical protein [Edaphocola aurantiacus]|uniref:hypothetical protein n=1 Tax=Edaphocola aurantiacus TaxID=2601682 RepID=UPI001C9894F1|nr:hypothetical protein [Edaphocola aurantiacus]